ncbi:hypothetical protein EAG_14538 [Camponotus floridanus]|uniref:Uncharacterized protein n=1 Tax=Camponotus floridanus TaxID=104421 RepID=E2AKI9_CAMFO|nr:hypothetical protein EAG_14538 [Camponotus floridanus]
MSPSDTIPADSIGCIVNQSGLISHSPLWTCYPIHYREIKCTVNHSNHVQQVSELDLLRIRVTRDGLAIHGSMFLAIDGDITATEARFLGRLAGVGSCAEVERGSGEVEREKADGKGLSAGRERGEGGDTRPLGRDEGAQGVGDSVQIRDEIHDVVVAIDSLQPRYVGRDVVLARESKSRRATRVELLETRPRTVAAPREVTPAPVLSNQPDSLISRTLDLSRPWKCLLSDGSYDARDGGGPDGHAVSRTVAALGGSLFGRWVALSKHRERAAVTSIASVEPAGI